MSCATSTTRFIAFASASRSAKRWALVVGQRGLHPLQGAEHGSTSVAWASGNVPSVAWASGNVPSGARP